MAALCTKLLESRHLDSRRNNTKYLFHLCQIAASQYKFEGKDLQGMLLKHCKISTELKEKANEHGFAQIFTNQDLSQRMMSIIYALKRAYMGIW